MEQQYSFCLYKVQLEKWYQFVKNGSQVHEYTATFLQESQSHHQLYITFDNKIATIINFLLLHSQFHQYEQKILLAIAEELYHVKFIDKRHLRYIQQQKKSTMAKKIGHFFETIEQLKNQNKQQKLQPQTISQQWQNETKVQLEAFWTLVVVSDFRYHLLYQLYYVVDQCKEVKDNLALYHYVLNIGIIEKSSKKEEQTVTKSQLISESTNYTAQKVEKQNLSTNTSEKIQNKLVEDSKPSNSKDQSYHAMKLYMASYLQNKNHLKNLADDYLVRKVYRNSLFFNKKLNLILEQIDLFMKYAKDNLFIDPSYRMEIFGSLRSKLALRQEYDIDITFVHKTKKNLERQFASNVLHTIDNRIYEHLLHPTWVKNTRLFNFAKLAIPVLKIEVNQLEFLNTFGIEKIEKVDVTVGNITAAINSELIQHYAKIPQIQLFILLVKLWAKKTNVINARRPIDGLSGYAVVMMCLYYLMDTQQVKFLEVTQEQIKNVEIGSIVPDLSEVKMKPLAENFLKFLDYYHEYGHFQKQKKIVCLLKHCSRAKQFWNENFIINMYDFIDNTNPGRLEMKMKQMFFANVQKARIVMSTMSKQAIRENLFVPAEFQQTYLRANRKY